ncbi:aminotransferase class I/II-fold pyridoxal phosphate-dependent enzyme [candidate division KSB1 bacterium]|nr:aminotransferase class I/II-fold pyridoxal phosphate-dependent enzyme [candidate division KSB1 bacterium]
MQIRRKPKIEINAEAKQFINLYASLGERAENFLPDQIFDMLTNFVRLCHEEPDDPNRLQLEINKALLELKEAIPGYVDVSLMIFPHESSKNYEYSSRRKGFIDKLNHLMDIELIDEPQKVQVRNILNLHDFSIGTPPVNKQSIDFLYQVLLGDQVRELRKFRDIIGITGYVEETQWNYLLDVMDQMIVQSTHYTTAAERNAFLTKSESTVNFKGLNGFIRTVVSGGPETVIKLIKDEIFGPDVVRVIEFLSPEQVYEEISNDTTSIFCITAQHLRTNPLRNIKWFPVLSRMVFVDDSPQARSTNTSLVFAFHNEIINTLNKVHTKKLGAPANTQLNLRLILEKVNAENITRFRQAAEAKIKDYEDELRQLKNEQLAEPDNPAQDIILYKFDEFAQQVLKDKYILSKFASFLVFIEKLIDPSKHEKINRVLMDEYEQRMKDYFYGGSSDIHITTIVEGGGRNQIKTYGEYLLQKKHKPLAAEVIERCRVILKIIPDNYQRTLHTHFHRNFGLNLFLEKYKEYLTKVENEATNKGRFRNLLIDLGIEAKYSKLNKNEQQIIKAFMANLGNLAKTSISDDVQMIIRDLVLNRFTVKPFIFLNQQAAWEYQDLFPIEKFDINPFDIEIELDEDGRIDYDRFLTKLERIKSTFQLFDETGSIWDMFCSNSTILINDPANPTGYTDFNNVSLLRFLKFMSTTQLTLFLDEAYNDAVYIEDPEEPKWCTISRYIINNIATFARISMVASLSTTKNLGAPGDRLGAIAVTDARTDVIAYAKRHSAIDYGNSNSLFLLVNVLEVAQQARLIKKEMDENLPKDASRQRIKKKLSDFISEQSRINEPQSINTKGAASKRESLFEGSPLHIFLLDELLSLDRLDVLELPDDFKYKGEAFFSYYKKHIVHELNKFRINRIFRHESNKRLHLAKEVAQRVLDEEKHENIRILHSDGSYLFNLVLQDYFSYLDLEKFTQKLSEERGLAAIPYPTGFVRFSLGGYIEGTEESYRIFAAEIKNSLQLFLKYWQEFSQLKLNGPNKSETDDILKSLFLSPSDVQFVIDVLNDYVDIKNLQKNKLNSLTINEITTMYQPFPDVSGVTINSIANSPNAVLEFYENIGQCPDLPAFINSKAFSKVYENLLPQIHHKIPAIRGLDINTVLTKYGKATLLKYVISKLEFQPDSHLLDDPNEMLIMLEILIELERLLFSDSKFKVMALNANEQDTSGDLARLEGYNEILKKYIRELMLHFNLPFEQELSEPSREQLFMCAIETLEKIIGKSLDGINVELVIDSLVNELKADQSLSAHLFVDQILGYAYNNLKDWILRPGSEYHEQLLKIFMLKSQGDLAEQLLGLAERLSNQLSNHKEADTRLFVEHLLPDLLLDIYKSIDQKRQFKIDETMLKVNVRMNVLYLTGLLNQSRHTDYYSEYNHILIRMILLEYERQNSSDNELIQHGYSLYTNITDFKNKTLTDYENGSLKWINDVMTKCGVIAAEQPIQARTRMNTDAKKREYPFHRVDRIEPDIQPTNINSPRDFIKNMSTRPSSRFFVNRLAKFVENMDREDYRCRIVNDGLVNELYIIQKSYLKYLADNYRLLKPGAIPLQEVKEFLPDIIIFYGAPGKVISYPNVGYFDIKGPYGNIKTMVTPLEVKADYFGNIKKPRLTLLNEKVKEMGGVPVHGSFVVVEGDDGSLFGVMIAGDSGVGKSEMLAAMMLKWMKKNLGGIRSIKMVAGDMLHVFPDKEGNLYGIGTEVGDFSRVTDFDPEFIRMYNMLFESSADSNVENLNSRSTFSGFCDISMPFKIDIILTAHNFGRTEAGIIKYSNVENFILYRDSHGERKEKATSSDNPHFQRTLLRYTGDRNIVEVLDQHGNYLDEVLDWEQDSFTKKHYLASSYKRIDKLDVEEIVNKIFVDKHFVHDGQTYRIEAVKFDIIKNRFNARSVATEESGGEVIYTIDRTMFSQIFNSLASTPAGNPFISEHGEFDTRQHLIRILKGGNDGKGKGRNIQCAILSTDLGKKGKEISGPQKAAQDVIRLIQEVRTARPDISAAKNQVKKKIDECYGWLFLDHKKSLEVERYNFVLYQLEMMRKAKFVRIDDMKTAIDITRIKGFEPLPANRPFSPLLVTPNVNIELNTFTETYEQLMALPNIREFSEKFYSDCESVYIAIGYSESTIVNNMIVQLLLLNGYISVDDLSRAKLTEKANRETVAAAKFAAVKKYRESLEKKEKTRVKE